MSAVTNSKTIVFNRLFSVKSVPKWDTEIGQIYYNLLLHTLISMSSLCKFLRYYTSSLCLCSQTVRMLLFHDIRVTETYIHTHTHHDCNVTKTKTRLIWILLYLLNWRHKSNFKYEEKTPNCEIFWQTDILLCIHKSV